MTREEKATELGRKAYHNGITAPVQDGELMKMVEGGEVGKNIGIFKAWNRGWTVENINALIGEG